MIIKIDPKTRISVNETCFALMKPGKRDGKAAWDEDKWFSSLEDCIQWIVQRNLSRKRSVVSLKEFISAYRRVVAEVRDIRSKNIL